MSSTPRDLTPTQIAAELDRHIIGQANAKRAVAVALRNRYRRSMLPAELRNDIIPKNILMIGPTGVGKTEIARRLAQLANAPFVKVEATKFTEVGYVGRNVDSMIRDLVAAAIRMVEAEKSKDVAQDARKRAIDRIVDILQPLRPEPASEMPEEGDAAVSDALQRMFQPLMEQLRAPGQAPGATAAQASQEQAATDDHDRERRERIRARIRKQVEEGVRDSDRILIPASDKPRLGFPGLSLGQDDETAGDMSRMLGAFMPRSKRSRYVTIAEAREIFTEEAVQEMIDQDAVIREAIQRTEQSGIVFIDEIDKIAGGSHATGGPDISREGVQRDILPIIEGSTVNTKYGPVNTDHILFIAAGAFHVSKPSDLIPELQGRLPIRVELETLSEDDMERILVEPRSSLTRQYRELLATEGVHLEFTKDGIRELARVATDVNRRTENIGARRLHTVLELLLDDVSFAAPESAGNVVVDAPYVQRVLAHVVEDEDLSRYIL